MRLLLGLVLVLGAGCAVTGGEEFAQERFREARDAPATRIDPAPLAHVTAPLAPTAAASFSDPLDLATALRLAVETSERVRSAGEDLYQAHLARVQARATLLPALTIRATHFEQEADFATPPPGVRFGNLLREQQTARLEARAPILRLGSWLAVAQARRLIHAAEARVQAERLAIEQATADLFYAALTAERQAATFEAARARDVQRLREVRDRAAIGIARRTEVLFIETDLGRTEASLAQATEGLRELRDRLSLLIGRPLRGDLVEPRPGGAVEPRALAERVLPDLVEEALATRPDIRALREDIDVADGGRRVEVGALAPNVDFTGNYWAHREGSLEDVDWDLSVELSLPVFEGFAHGARIREAESRVRQARLALEAQARAVAAGVTSAWRDLRAASAALVSAEAAQRAATENFEQLESEYRLGLASNLEVVEAQQQLTAARLAYETVRLDRQRLAVELRFLMGGLGEDPR